jgi:hypothetical protein
VPDRFLVAIITFFAFVIVARWVHEAGLRALSPEQKAAVLDSQAGLRKWGLLIAVPLILLAFYLPSYAPWLILAYLAIILGFSYRRLRALALPPSYRRAFIAYCGLYLVGAAIFFGVIYVRQLPL